MSAPSPFVRMCDCDHCRGRSAVTCACGHPLSAHLRHQFHSCSFCVWCDRFVEPREAVS